MRTVGAPSIGRRALALMTVLMAAAVLSMLCISLVLLSRTGLLTSEQFRRRQSLLQACYSGLDYAKVRLCQPGDWGNTPFASSYSDPELVIQETGSLVTGNLTASGATFQIQVVNNLRGTARLPAPPWSRSGVEVSPRTALVAVEGQLEGSRKRFEVVLTRDSQLTNAIYASGNLTLDVNPTSPAGALTVSSVLPRATSLKAGSDVYLSNSTKVSFAPKGQMQAGSDIYDNSTVSVNSAGNIISASGIGLQSNAALKAAAASAMSATFNFAPLAAPKFNPSKLADPGASTVSLSPGEYRFISGDTVVYNPGGANTTYTGSLAGGAVILKDYRFMPDANRKVEVPGNLTISANITTFSYTAPTGASPWGSISAGNNPEPFTASLGLGYDTGGLPVGARAQNRFSVQGNLTVVGDIVGSGQLFVGTSTAGGRLNLQGNSFLSGTRTNDLAVVAHDSVILGDVSALASQQPFASLPGDFAHFAAAASKAMGDPGVNATLRNYTGASSSQLAAAGNLMMSEPVGDLSSYKSALNATLGGTLSGTGAFTAGNYAGMDLSRVPIITSTHSVAPTSVLTALTEYLGNVSASTGCVTLEQHLHVREYLKSVETGQFKTSLIDWGDPAYTANTTFNELRNKVVNQVAAYNQDARNSGRGLLDYLINSTVDPYQESQRFDFNFGGILYAQNNILVQLASQFKLLGSMITQSPTGAITIKNLTAGSLRYDPTACEDQFDWTKTGLIPLFFWTD